MQIRVKQLLLGLTGAALLLTSAAAEEATRRPFAVTSSAVGPEAEAVDASLVDGFVESLNARKTFNANVTPKNAAYWMKPPQSTTSERISFVAVAVGEHRDLLALVWDNKATTVLAAARRQCRVGVKGRRDWFGPGPNQIGDNAVKELAADIGHAWTPGLARKEDRRVQVTTTGWNVTAADLTGGIDAMVKDKKGGEPERPVIASGAAVDAMKALTFAALSESGFEATSETAPATLAIEVAQAADHYAFRCTLTRDGKTTKYQRRFVARNEVYEHIVTATRKMLQWRESVRDAAHLGDGPVEPLAASKGIVVATVGGDLCGIDTLTGENKWKIEAPPKSSPRYQAVGSGAQAGVVGFLRGSERIEVATGKPTAFSATIPVLPFAFDLVGDRAAVMRDTAVSLSQGGKELWKITFPEPLACGPAIAGESVIIGNDAGELIALAAADGKEIWRKPMSVRLRGSVTLIDDRVIVGSLEGTLLAVSPKDGAILWQHAARDLPLTKPSLLDGMLLVADKGNTIWLLDPKTGAPRANFVAPTWLRGVSVVENAGKKWVACVDLRGVVRFLGAADLKPIRETDLATPLNGTMVAASDFPLTWASHDDLEQKSPGLLVGADDGWLYLIDLPE